MSIREDLVTSAVSFLQDPKVSSSSLQIKLSFLTSKGLNDTEVQEALRRAGQSPELPATAPYPSSQSMASPYPAAGPSHSSSASHGGGVPPGWDQRMLRAPPPERPGRDWRDYFVMAVVSGGVMYGLSALAKKYLVPHLTPPPAPLFTQTSQDLNAQFETITTDLQTLRTSTEQLKAELETERDKVRSLVTEVTRTLEEVRKREDEEKGWREEVSSEVEGIKENLPKLLKSHTALLQTNLTSLQSELATLKPLLTSRAQPSSGMSKPLGLGFNTNGSAPSIPAWQRAVPSSTLSEGDAAKSTEEKAEGSSS